MEEKKSHFIRQIIEQDLKTGKHQTVITRFPPEPNGYLHIGHAKSMCLNFGLAKEFGGRCHLRFDDTNPEKESPEFVRSIQEDVRWLGFDWGEHLYFASDYFEQFYQYALELIKRSKAYVCHLTPEQIREYRGTLTEPGRESPYRNRSVEENLKLFIQMKNGEFAEGECVLRAKIDMASPNLNLRDPVIYRIKKVSHHRTGDKWCIYPTYDFAHCLSDAIEGITHSLCTLEFEDHRPLYDWFLDQLEDKIPCHPQQIEFARLNLTYTVLSKRKLTKLVEDKIVSGWDDPRMPTISGMRRRGFPPEAIREFCERIGIAKSDNLVDYAMLEFCVREVLNKTALRFMGVFDPLKVVITNYPEDKIEELDAVNNPEDPSAGTRKVPFGREIYIERSDFREDPPRKYFRLAPGKEVRLRYAYYIRCEKVIKDEQGRVIELHCTYDPATKGGFSPDGRKVKGTLHWVALKQAKPLEARLYDRLFQVENPGLEEKKGRSFQELLNPKSLEVVQVLAEPALFELLPGTNFQFERIGYFVVEQNEQERFVVNRTVTLKDSWAKLEAKLNQKKK